MHKFKESKEFYSPAKRRLTIPLIIGAILFLSNPKLASATVCLPEPNLLYLNCEASACEGFFILSEYPYPNFASTCQYRTSLIDLEKSQAEAYATHLTEINPFKEIKNIEVTSNFSCIQNSYNSHEDGWPSECAFPQHYEIKEIKQINDFDSFSDLKLSKETLVRQSQNQFTREVVLNFGKIIIPVALLPLLLIWLVSKGLSLRAIGGVSLIIILLQFLSIRLVYFNAYNYAFMTIITIVVPVAVTIELIFLISVIRSRLNQI